MYQAKVINRFKCRLTRRVYDPGDIYEAETWERLVELASLDPPRVELPPQDVVEGASAKSKRRKTRVEG